MADGVQDGMVIGMGCVSVFVYNLWAWYTWRGRRSPGGVQYCNLTLALTLRWVALSAVFHDADVPGTDCQLYHLLVLPHSLHLEDRKGPMGQVGPDPHARLHCLSLQDNIACGAT